MVSGETFVFGVFGADSVFGRATMMKRFLTAVVVLAESPERIAVPVGVLTNPTTSRLMTRMSLITTEVAPSGGDCGVPQDVSHRQGTSLDMTVADVTMMLTRIGASDRRTPTRFGR